MRAVCVFLGSTRQDLDPDCRPGARRALDHAKASCEEMETWDADFENSLDVCRRKVQLTSTHYVGMFAYRRGWEPRLSLSITEAEFDWARECPNKPMAVFLPNPASTFALTLQERAKDQAPEHTKAQEEFRRRVASLGTHMLFDDPMDLAIRVARKALIWVNGGLLGLENPAETRANRHRPLPSQTDVRGLGRKRQSDEVQSTLELVPATARGIAFLVSGRGGHGHDAVLARIARRLDQDSDETLTQIPVSFAVPWLRNDVAALIATVATTLNPDLETPTLGHLIAELGMRLRSTNVVLEIRHAQRMKGGLTEFVESFWRPVMAGLPETRGRRLYALVEYEGALDARDEGCCQPPCKEQNDGFRFQAGRLTKLAPLTAFTASEIERWLAPRVDTGDQATLLAQALLKETRGHPLTVYHRLLDPAFWAAAGD
jgi:hypothetical protein